MQDVIPECSLPETKLQGYLDGVSLRSQCACQNSCAAAMKQTLGAPLEALRYQTAIACPDRVLTYARYGSTLVGSRKDPHIIWYMDICVYVQANSS